jgi:Xaa-Pro aminopeptidase
LRTACDRGGGGYTGGVLANHLRRACATRRGRLQSLLGACPALIPAGRPRARNYAANPHPFRASSHFLYFVGLPLEGAALFVDEGVSVLLVPDRDPHDDLWHGPTPDHAELAEITGLAVQSVHSLAGLRGDRTVATIPQLDRADGEHWAEVLGRPCDELGVSDADEVLLEALVKLRLAHDEAAIEELRRAAEASVRAHLVGMGATRQGRHEREICAEMEAVFARRGFGTAYNSIVTVHGEVLHNHHHHLRMDAGQLLLADVGAETDTGYAADITRTWPVSGRFSSTQREIYELVLAAQRAAIGSVRPGVRYRDVHCRAARVLTDGLVSLGVLRGEVDGLMEQGAHALFFPHGIGHLLGLDVHDMEDLGDRAGYAPGRERARQFGISYLRLDRDLEPGMLVTIEPGFYQVPSLLADPARVGLSSSALDRAKLARFSDVRGIRIEDDVLVTADSHEVLTGALPREPDEIEALVGIAVS